MNLQEYLDFKGISGRKFRKKLGISESWFYLFKNHHKGKNPSYEVAKQIEDLTEGMVTVNDLIILKKGEKN